MDFLLVKGGEAPTLPTLKPQSMHQHVEQALASALGLKQIAPCLLSLEHLNDFVINISQFAKRTRGTERSVH